MALINFISKSEMNGQLDMPWADKHPQWEQQCRAAVDDSALKQIGLCVVRPVHPSSDEFWWWLIYHIFPNFLFMVQMQTHKLVVHEYLPNLGDYYTPKIKLFS